MKKRGQSSVEFLIFIGIASLMFMTFIVIATSYLNGITKNREIIDGQDTAKIIRNEINLAAGVKGNYERVLELPETVNGRPYSIQIDNRDLIITIESSAFTMPLSSKVYSSFNNPVDINPVTAGQYVIKKENEIITFEKKQ